MRRLIELTKNWKHRNLLHILGGFILSFLLNFLFCWYYSIIIIFLVANVWELNQIKYFKGKYSITDIILTILGCVIEIIII